LDSLYQFALDKTVCMWRKNLSAAFRTIRKDVVDNFSFITTNLYNCGEPNLTFVDFSAGGQQSYVEDCQVCCRPNILYVRIDEDTLDIEIDTEYEGW